MKRRPLSQRLRKGPHPHTFTLTETMPRFTKGGSCPYQVRDTFLHRGFCTSETRIWARILGNEFWAPEFWTRIPGSNFLSLFFSSKRGPQKNSPSRNSPLKIHLPEFNPRKSSRKIFTLPLCRAVWLIILELCRDVLRPWGVRKACRPRRGGFMEQLLKQNSQLSVRS